MSQYPIQGLQEVWQYRLPLLIILDVGLALGAGLWYWLKLQTKLD